MKWDASRYSRKVEHYRGQIQGTENKLLERFPPIQGAEEVLRRESEGRSLPIVREGCVVKDQFGRVLLWSLPSIFSPEFQVSRAVIVMLLDLTAFQSYILLRHTLFLKTELKIEKGVPQDIQKPPIRNWRNGPTLFGTPGEYGAGQVLLSPAWRPAGHQV